MSALTPFTFDGQAVRVITDEHGEPWFVPADACSILGHTNPSQAVAQHVHADDARKATLTIREGSRDVTRERTLVNESGLYALIFGSNLPAAIAFKRWVTREVLPAIRKTGGYQVAASLPQDYKAALRALADEVEAKEMAEARAEKSEKVVNAVESAAGITATEFHKHYFSDVGARVFFEKLYSLHLLIDQRGTRGRDDRGRLKNGRQHRHPAAAGKRFFYLHGRMDSEGVRREDVLVRPGRPEVELVEFLVSKGLPANINAFTGARAPLELIA